MYIVICHLHIVKINSDTSKKLVKELQIGSVPYLVLYVNNQMQYSQKGIIAREELSEVLQKIF